jgi:hypothetical protein
VNAWPEPRRGGGVLATALAKAEAWLFEPSEPSVAGAAPGPPARPVVAVRGLARGCGASAVARALAVALAREDPSGASALAGCAVGGGPRLATPAAARLGRALADLGCGGVRASGRVCLLANDDPLAAVVARRACPVVIDVAQSSPPGESLGLADHVVLVGSPDVERSLAVAVETSLSAAGHSVDLVLSRVEDVEAAGLELPGAVIIGESRLAAQVALACREPRGPFAEPIADLAERCRSRAPA